MVEYRYHVVLAASFSEGGQYLEDVAYLFQLFHHRRCGGIGFGHFVLRLYPTVWYPTEFPLCLRQTSVGYGTAVDGS